MSLYNNVAESLSASGLLGSIKSGISSAVGGVSSSVSSALGGGKLATAVTKYGANMANTAAQNMINKHISPQMAKMINTGGGMLGDVLSGDFEGAAVRLLDSGLLSKYFPGLGGIASQAAYWGTPTPLMGGISPSEAKRIHDESRATEFARKNLFLIEIDSPLQGDVSSRFNLFVTDVEYTPMILSGDKRKIGAAHTDAVNSSDPIELRITTLDDKSGFIKRWFMAHAGAAVARDGTVGTPASYAVGVKIVHAFITSESNQGGYEDVGLFRPANIDISLSRREDGLQEVQMTFTQLDTFMRK